MQQLLSLLIVIILCCSKYSECRQFRFDYKYFQDVDGYFKYSAVPATWLDANLRCQFEGSELASPINSLMRHVMQEFSKSDQETNKALWTGISAIFSKGDYFSVGGVPLARMPITWAKNEPDNFQNCEDCLILLQNGTLADVSCNDTFPYACFRKKTSLVTECGTTDPAEGGYLAIVDVVGEHLVLKDIFAKNPSNTLFGYARDSAHIGFRDLDGRGTWTTIHGDRVEDLIAASKGNWSNNQPDSVSRNGVIQQCGSIFRSGLFDDNFCDLPTPFICEKSPDSLINLD
ncbi:hypothetical protein K1T71_003766 [Dendrolimus kikuchii]|uniref:Uncharacterized protein n=1 Tax=Dendrolimus kikuchii TaxID=765133 RepID=A0ACC1D936_9NEOP|nr:hypothetical protein K1T71_003766 [Dendrolimus kikuchii]